MDEAGSGGHIPRGKSLTAMVADRLRAEIIDGHIPLGTLLSEKTIAENYGVSKTPVREALVQLQAIDLVTILPQRGGLVFQPDKDQVRELCEVRLELECAGLRLSMKRNRASLGNALAEIVSRMRVDLDLEDPTSYQQLDNAFHRAFFAHCGNALLATTYEKFNPRICALRTHLSTPQPTLLRRSFEEHGLMVELVKVDDGAGALTLMREHITRTQDYYSRAIPNLGGPVATGGRPRFSKGGSQ